MFLGKDFEALKILTIMETEQSSKTLNRNRKLN